MHVVTGPKRNSTEFVPGSHKEAWDAHPPERLTAEQLLQIPTTAGDIVVLHWGLLHRGRPWKEATPRPLFYFLFTPPDADLAGVENTTEFFDRTAAEDTVCIPLEPCVPAHCDRRV